MILEYNILYFDIESHALIKSTLTCKIDSFFNEKHNEKVATSSLWSAASILKTYFQTMGLISNLYDALPLLKSKLKNWLKQDKPQQAKALSAVQISQFLNTAPNSAKFLPIKVDAIISIHGALRKKEQVMLKYGDFTLESGRIKISLHRLKQPGPYSMSEFYINQQDSVNTINLYLNCFTNLSPFDRFFRKLNEKLQGTNQIIGEHQLASYPRIIAEFLNLPNVFFIYMY